MAGNEVETHPRWMLMFEVWNGYEKSKEEDDEDMMVSSEHGCVLRSTFHVVFILLCIYAKMLNIHTNYWQDCLYLLPEY